LNFSLSPHHRLSKLPTVLDQWKHHSAPRAILLVCLGAILFGAPGRLGAGPSPIGKKLIATGWDSPTAACFRQHVTSFAEGPFDGTVIRPTRRLTDGSVVSASYAFSRELWHEKEFDEMIADLQAAQPTGGTENFLLMNVNPGNVDWFDDAGWKEIVAHCRLLARVAKRSGLRGLAFDPEPYSPPATPFNYTRQSEREHKSFANYEAKVRQRGREVMQAMSAEFPDMVILAYFLFSNLPHATDNPRFLKMLQSHDYNLMPAFIDGWMEKIPSAMMLIDGNEYSYKYNSPAAFDDSYNRLKKDAASFFSPKNRPKLQQLQIGQAIYLDAYCNSPEDYWYIDPQGMTPVERLSHNLASALQASDNYVWVYGMKGRWWPSMMNYPLWEDRLPGVTAAIKRAKELTLPSISPRQ
jgi:hypothetical protein